MVWIQIRTDILWGSKLFAKGFQQTFKVTANKEVNRVAAKPHCQAIYCKYSKISDKKAQKNSANPDQTACLIRFFPVCYSEKHFVTTSILFLRKRNSKFEILEHSPYTITIVSQLVRKGTLLHSPCEEQKCKRFSLPKFGVKYQPHYQWKNRNFSLVLREKIMSLFLSKNNVP